MKAALEIFDPLATAVDWLDAYREGDLNTLVNMYSEHGVIECGCDRNLTTITWHSLHSYWLRRVANYPAGDLEDLQLAPGGASVTYMTLGVPVRATLIFGQGGKISRQLCGILK